MCLIKAYSTKQSAAVLLEERGNVDLSSACVSVYSSFEMRRDRRSEQSFPCACETLRLVFLSFSKYCHHTFLNSPRPVLIGLFKYFPYAGWEKWDGAGVTADISLTETGFHIKANHLEGQVKLGLIGVNGGRGVFFFGFFSSNVHSVPRICWEGAFEGKFEQQKKKKRNKKRKERKRSLVFFLANVLVHQRRRTLNKENLGAVRFEKREPLFPGCN